MYSCKFKMGSFNQSVYKKCNIYIVIIENVSTILIFKPIFQVYYGLVESKFICGLFVWGCSNEIAEKTTKNHLSQI